MIIFFFSNNITGEYTAGNKLNEIVRLLFIKFLPHTNDGRCGESSNGKSSAAALDIPGNSDKYLDCASSIL